DQSRHQEEDEGEDAGQIAHPVSIHGVADKAHVGIPVQEIPFTFALFLQVPLGLFQFFLGIGNLLFGIRLLGLEFLIPVGILGFSVLQLLTAVLKLGPAVLQLSLCIHQLLFGIGQLPFPGSQLGLTVLQ